METRSMILRLAAIAAAAALIGCDNSITISPEYLGVVISPRPISIPVGGTMVFTGTVSNNLSTPLWSFLDSTYANNIGTLTPISGSSDTILYTAPSTPPIYAQTPSGITQGSVTLNVTTTSPPGTSIPVVGDSVSFVVTSPSVAVTLTPAAATVALNSTAQFIGYAVGNLNNTLTWYANGYLGGAVPVPLSSPVTYTYPYGTIDSAGTYVAPSSMPSSGNTVTINIISQADPTKTASAVVTLH